MFVGKPCFIALLSFVLGFAIGEVDRSVSYNAKCSKFHIRKSTIIKTQQSIHDGAEFLGKKVTTSSRGCHKQCCSTLGCNLVMLKYDVESSVERVNCFMFNCRSPSVCSFFKHPSYHSYAALEYVSEDGGKTQDNEGILLILFYTLMYCETRLLYSRFLGFFKKRSNNYVAWMKIQMYI